METIKKYNLNFTQVCNKVLNDVNISLRAKGLYAYLFSKPDNWEFHLPIMQKELKESRGQVYSAIKELIEFGYIERFQKNENGKFGGITYVFIPVYGNDRICKNRNTENLNTNNTDINNINNLNNTDIKIKEIKEKENLDYGNVQEAFSLWLEYKKEKKKAYKPIGLKIALKKLIKLSDNDSQKAMEIVESAISNNYDGFFALSKPRMTRQTSMFCDENGVPY